MKKIWFIPLCAVLLNAQSFDAFLSDALVRSPYLQANNLALEVAEERGALTRRYKNPQLSLEASNFSADAGGSEGGYRVALSQPIRLWGVGNARESLATATKEQAKSFTQMRRGEFIAKLSLLYANYKSRVKLESLAKEELAISKKIALISKERYESGTTARVKYMQTELDAKGVENFLNERRAQRVVAYYTLLGFAGASKEVELEENHTFTLGSVRSLENSAELTYLKKKQEKSLSEVELLSNKLEWVELYGEFEQEPDQSIARVGVDIPLVLFNSRAEEKNLAKLEAKKSQLLAQNLTRVQMMRLKEIEKSLEVLEQLSHTTQTLLASQKELLAMYEDGYKVANINLIELQMIKNQLIETREKAIEIERTKEQKIIEQNLLTGEYNE